MPVMFRCKIEEHCRFTTSSHQQNPSMPWTQLVDELGNVLNHNPYPRACYYQCHECRVAYTRIQEGDTINFYQGEISLHRRSDAKPFHIEKLEVKNG